MSFAFSASPYNEEEIEQFSSTIINDKRNKKIKNNSTLKKPITSPKVKEMLNTINNDSYKIDDEGDNLVQFSPPVYPQSATQNKKQVSEDTSLLGSTGSGDAPVGTEGFDNLPNTYVPYYNQMSQGNGNKDQLLEKLNYMIHLIEEQKDEKTGHIMEELILYSFLGVFMIFIVDSFARAGKYVR